MTTKQSNAYKVDIFMAGSIQRIKDCCLDYCSRVGLCVTVTPTSYVYTNGQEEGAIIGLINYPKFETTKELIRIKAEELAYFLMDNCNQRSFTIQDGETATYYAKEVK